MRASTSRGTAATHHQGLRKLLYLALATSIFILSGCIDIFGEIHIHRDNSATGSLTLSIDKETASLMGISSPDQLLPLVEEERGSSDLGQTEWSTNTTDSTYELIAKGTFTDEDSLWRIESSGSQQTITLLNSDTSPGGVMKVKFHVDGKITSIEGANLRKESANTFVLDAPLDTQWEQVVVVDTSKSSHTAFWIVGGGIVAVGLAALGLVWQARRNSSPQPWASQPPLPSGGWPPPSVGSTGGQPPMPPGSWQPPPPGGQPPMPPGSWQPPPPGSLPPMPPEGGENDWPSDDPQAR